MSSNTRPPMLSQGEMMSLMNRLAMMSEETPGDVGTLAPPSKPGSSPGCSAMMTSPEEEMPPRPCTVGLRPRLGRGEEGTPCSPTFSPQDQGMDLQLGIRMKQPRSSLEQLGIGMRREGADFKMEADGPAIMEDQGQPQPTLVAGGAVVNFPAREFPHSGTQPVSDTCGSTRDTGGREDRAVAAHMGVQPMGNLTSDSVDLDFDLGLQKLVSGSGSDCSTGGGSEASTDSNDVDMGRRPAENDLLPLPTQVCASKKKVEVEVKDGGYQGLMHGQDERQLQEFVKELKFKQFNSGIIIWLEGLRPALVKGVLRYEMEKQFTVLKDLQPNARCPQGVYLCQDLSSHKLFVLKKISTMNYDLPGLEFLTRHAESFLPKIYGVYKEHELVWIFEEYVEGELPKCDWTPSQVSQFARCLLSACHFLHECGLAHCDLKPSNVMVHDKNNPASLVIIDFESAKHKNSRFIKGGHTTTFLPPWHWELPEDSFSPLLMVADLWAVACILVSLLEGSSWNQKLQYHQQQQQQRKHLRELGVNSKAQHHQQFKGCCRTIWARKSAELTEQCRQKSQRPQEHGSKFCKRCRESFLYFLKTQGHQILSAHLGSLIAQRVDDSQWELLHRLLKYLTDCSSVRTINAAVALTLLQ